MQAGRSPLIRTRTSCAALLQSQPVSAAPARPATPAGPAACERQGDAQQAVNYAGIPRP